MGPAVTIVDPAEATSQLAKEQLAATGLLQTEGEGSVTVCCTADEARVRRLTAKMLPLEQCSFATIDLLAGEKL